MKKKRHHIWKNILIMAVVFLVASGSSIILQKTGVHEHITAIFIFAVFLTSILTDGYIYGIVSEFVVNTVAILIQLNSVTESVWIMFLVLHSEYLKQNLLQLKLL